MARLSRISCLSCGQKADVWHDSRERAPKVCHSCTEAAAFKKRDEELARIAALPIEERLRRIEAWIHDYRAPTPLSETRF